MKVAIVGAGVIGLTAAIRLREAGHEITIHAEQVPPETPASDRAGAIWYPGSVTDERVRGWAREGYAELGRLRAMPGSPVLARELVQVFDEPPDELPWWTEVLPSVRRLSAAECPEGFTAGMRASTLVIDVPSYMPWLRRRALDQLGCLLVAGRVERLEEVAPAGGVVINCAGLDGCRLGGEPEMALPRSGHTIRISPLPEGTPVTFLDRDPREPAYVFPRGADALLGGTDYPGDASTTPDPRIAQRIFERCAQLVPAVRSATRLEVRVGVRPGRRGGLPRLEGPLPCGGGQAVHCYGHGSIGHTLAWGCAREIVERVDATI